MARTFQEVRLIRLLSALENVMLAFPRQVGERFWRALLRVGIAGRERECRDAAAVLLERVGLSESKSQLAGTFSYGQQKLLSLACCIATQAQVLLLDEPVGGVDPEVTAQILSLLRCLRDEGKLIMFVEHDMAAVRELADMTVVLDEGKIIAQGESREVLDRSEIMDAYVT
jgi:ABC-type branched-subunit amino acid transport system ATPase component